MRSIAIHVPLIYGLVFATTSIAQQPVGIHQPKPDPATSAAKTFRLAVACPASAVVIIDGQVTRSGEKVRQYTLSIPAGTIEVSMVVVQNGQSIWSDMLDVRSTDSTTIVVGPNARPKATTATVDTSNRVESPSANYDVNSLKIDGLIKSNSNLENKVDSLIRLQPPEQLAKQIALNGWNDSLGRREEELKERKKSFDDDRKQYQESINGLTAILKQMQSNLVQPGAAQPGAAQPAAKPKST